MNFQKEKQGQELINEAEELGVEMEDLSLGGRVAFRGSEGFAELQKRVRSAKNAQYTQWTWIIALVSAIAAVVSAIAAWVAISK